jgi:chromosome segregation ATPase
LSYIGNVIIEAIGPDGIVSNDKTRILGKTLDEIKALVDCDSDLKQRLQKALYQRDTYKDALENTSKNNDLLVAEQRHVINDLQAQAAKFGDLLEENERLKRRIESQRGTINDLVKDLQDTKERNDRQADTIATYQRLTGNLMSALKRYQDEAKEDPRRPGVVPGGPEVAQGDPGCACKLICQHGKGKDKYPPGYPG